MLAALSVQSCAEASPIADQLGETKLGTAHQCAILKSLHDNALTLSATAHSALAFSRVLERFSPGDFTSPVEALVTPQP